jgi:carboxymethylenebutenolidase
MCYDEDAVPPVAALAGITVDCRDLELTAADGTRFAAFSATAQSQAEVAIIVLPDVRGLHGFYTELAKRFAERGIPAVAVDYYGRTAGVGRRGKDFAYGDHASRLTPRGLYADLGAAIAYLRSPQGGSARAVLTVGFCIGGRIAVMAAAGGFGLAGVIGFYCWPAAGPDGSPGPTARAAELACPVLALMAGDDPGIPASDVDAFGQALAQAGVDYDVVTYPGAPHSFFDAKRSEYAEASLDAWDRVLAFIQRVSTGAQGE